MAEIFHNYYLEDREAVIKRNKKGFFVELFEGGVMAERRNVYSKSERYAEDLAENWVHGVIPSPSG
tara:strand:+ start:535 stop:732 length:198 start_codon:yes stop_codon:yes gene_type:complete